MFLLAAAACNAFPQGRSLASFTGIGSFVRRAFEDSLAGILNKRCVDVLLDIKKVRVGV